VGLETVDFQRRERLFSVQVCATSHQVLVTPTLAGRGLLNLSTLKLLHKISERAALLP
jgi:hypothetical protein